MVEVRRATALDAGSIAEVHVRAWQVAYRGLLPDGLLDGQSVTQREEMWRALTGEKSSAVYVAVRDGVVVGFCAAVPSRDGDAEAGVAEIAAIYVDPDVWREGVGQELMAVALRDLRDDGWRWVTLWVLAENRRARDFYARFGLTPDGSETSIEDSGAREVRLRAPITA